MIETLNSWDTDLFLALNGAHNSFWDFIMWWASNKLIWIPLYAFFLFLIIRVFKWKSIWILLSVAILITLSDQLSVHLFKNIFQRLRPCHEPLLDGLVHIVNGKCGGQFSFVSSHAANSFALATFILLLLKRNYKYLFIPVLIWLTLVGYSRIYLGVHYPGDIIVGGLFGFFIGWIVYFLISRLLIKI